MKSTQEPHTTENRSLSEIEHEIPSPTNANCTRKDAKSRYIPRNKSQSRRSYHPIRHNKRNRARKKLATTSTSSGKPKDPKEITRTLDKANNSRPHVASTSDRRPIARALPDHREEHKHNRHRRETTKRRENTQSARAGGCDGTRVRPSAMPPQRLLRMTSSLRDADTKSSNRKRFCTRLACVGAVLPHQKTANCDTRKFNTKLHPLPKYLRTAPHHVDVLGTHRTHQA